MTRMHVVGHLNYFTVITGVMWMVAGWHALLIEGPTGE